ncbi:MAG: hypothetical protein AAGF29_07070, partial [Pseudomonadota bacterium]
IKCSQAVSVLLAAACALVTAAPAQANEACAEAVRAIMTDTRQGQPAVKHVSRTIAGGAETLSLFWSTGFNEGLSASADGVPQSLFRDGSFFFTTDGGENWTLSRRYDDAEIEAIVDGMIWQAENADSFTCEEGAQFEGRVGNRYEVLYTQRSTQQPVRTVYWVDPVSSFVWRTENTFGEGEAAMQVIQDSEPAPDFVLPDPGN